MIQRPWDWEARLGAWAMAQIGKPFVWGTTDCASLTRGAISVIFDDDPWPQARPWFTSAREAIDTLRAIGSVSAWLETHGATRITLAYVQAGDIVISPPVEDETTEGCLIVCTNAQLLKVDAEHPVHVVPLTEAHPDSYALRLPYVW